MRHSMFRPKFSVLFLAAAALAVAVVYSLVVPNPAQAGSFKVLHSFCVKSNCGDGSQSHAALVMDAAGNLFGTTAGGGRDDGVVFELQLIQPKKFKFVKLYTFCRKFQCRDGEKPFGSLVVDTLGNLYGTAGGGGAGRDGLVFKLSPSEAGKWSETILYEFCHSFGCPDGSTPLFGLTYFGAAGGAPYDGTSPLFGTTSAGGANGGGTVFKLATAGGQWTETVLYSFCAVGGDQCLDGMEPQGGVIFDAVGNLLGTTFRGGDSQGQVTGGTGVAYELSANGDTWSETVLHHFCAADACADGAFPVGNLAIDSTGNLIGAAVAGGNPCKPDSRGCGVIFKIVPDGISSEESVLYALCAKRDCRDGFAPRSGPIIDSAGNVFGTASFGGGNDIDTYGLGGGVVYEFAGGSYKVLHRFCAAPNCTDGEYPMAAPTLDAAGELFGTTSVGGPFGTGLEGGTAFELTP